MSKYKKIYNDSAAEAEKKKNKKKKIKIAVISVLSVFAAAVIGFSAYFIVDKVVNSVKPIQRTEAEAKVIGTVTHVREDGSEKNETYGVYYDELRAITCFYKISIAKLAGYSDNGEAMAAWDNPTFVNAHREELENLVTTNLVNNYVPLVFCDEWNVDTDSEEADDYVQEQVELLVDESFNGNVSEYREWLDSEHMSDAYLRFSLKSGFLESSMYYVLVERGFFQYTQENYDDFINYVLSGNTENYCATYSILVEKQSDAQIIADDIGACENIGEKVSKMATYIGSAFNKDFGNSTSNMYYFMHGEMNSTYETAAFGLEIGEVGVSEATDDGYYVILRINPDKDYVNANWEDLLRGYQSAAMGAYSDSIAEEMKFAFNQEGEKIDLAAIK